MKLADTSFWVALAAARDHNHAAAVELWGRQERPVVVTNHVAGETWTFLRHRAGHSVASLAIDVFRSAQVQLVHVEERVEDDAWKWLRRHDERPYSFVDAISFGVMRRLRIREALTFDADFSAAGFTVVTA